MDCGRIKRYPGRGRRHDFDAGLRATISWCLENAAWLESVRTGEYRKWIERNYGARNGKGGV